MPFLTDDPEVIAGEERRRLGVSAAAQLSWQGAREAFFRWRELIESQGVFVYQLNLAEDDSRGFSVWDDRQVPVIVIDGHEGSYGAKIFTLLHEYAHILLRDPAESATKTPPTT